MVGEFRHSARRRPLKILIGCDKDKDKDKEKTVRKITPTEFTADRAWGALPIERIEGATTVRLHWTDKPYKWHVNDGPEVFVVLAGVVDMHAREGGEVVIHRLNLGDIFHAQDGDEHVAHPVGAARVLVIEQEGSI